MLIKQHTHTLYIYINTNLIIFYIPSQYSCQRNSRRRSCSRHFCHVHRATADPHKGHCRAVQGHKRHDAAWRDLLRGVLPAVCSPQRSGASEERRERGGRFLDFIPVWLRSWFYCSVHCQPLWWWGLFCESHERI